jgi:hypothetical protein
MEGSQSFRIGVNVRGHMIARPLMLGQGGQFVGLELAGTTSRVGNVGGSHDEGAQGCIDWRRVHGPGP